jgi:OOP family OmpA-OmpF porin
MLKRILASLFVTTTVLAGPAVGQLRSPDSGFYGGLGLGRTDSNLGGATDSKDDAWKAFGGYQFNRYFGLEAGYIDLGKVTTPAATLDSKAWQASAVGSLPLTEQFALTGKLGVAQAETETSGFGTDHNTDPTYGLGLRYNFTRQFGLRGEWERFRVSGNPFVGKSDTDVYSINAVFRFY